MLHTAFGQASIEGAHRIGGDGSVGTAEQTEHGRSDFVEQVQWRRCVVAPGSLERTVQADHAVQPEAERRREERHPPAHAEPEREDALDAVVAQRRDAGADVGRDAGPRRRPEMRTVIKVVAARLGAGRAPEPVDRKRVHAALRQPQGQLFVVRMEAANIGEDHHRAARPRRRSCPERGEPVAVGRLQLDALPVQCAAGDGLDRWTAVEIEAHVDAHGAIGRPRGSANRGSRMPGMPSPLVVQKYGGSSVADADRIRRVARRIARERAAGHDLVVVVSAMGDTTDELLGLAAAITDDPDPRELDVLLATGEHQSATLLSMALHALGVAAISLTGPQAGITTDGTYGRARIAGIEPRRVREELERGRVVIVAGFQGQRAAQAHEQEMTTLGRGGSDTTAVALAAALRAERCQIFTDVRGIFTADPRLVPDARQLPLIGYEEMLELAHQGAQVMQVRAVELGWVNDVVIEVLSSFEDAPGTLIKEDPLVEQRNKVRGLAHDRNVAKVTVVAVPDRPGIARAIFEPLASAGVNIDMIVQNVGHGGETDLSFTVPQVELGKAKKTLEPVVRELGARELTTDASVAKVSIVGAGLHNAPGYAARMFGVLADTGVNIEMISTSEVRITCMIAEEELEAALTALHAAFELERPEPVEVAAAG
jgi:aspartate kinase